MRNGVRTPSLTHFMFNAAIAGCLIVGLMSPAQSQTVESYRNIEGAQIQQGVQDLNDADIVSDGYAVQAAPEAVPDASETQSVETGFNCTPEQFTMFQQPTFSDQKSNYLLEGEITFPTSGYGVNFVREDDDFSSLTYEMNVIEPQGEVIETEIPQPVYFDVLADADLSELIIKPGENAEAINFNGIRCKRKAGW